MEQERFPFQKVLQGRWSSRLLQDLLSQTQKAANEAVFLMSPLSALGGVKLATLPFPPPSLRSFSLDQSPAAHPSSSDRSGSRLVSLILGILQSFRGIWEGNRNFAMTDLDDVLSSVPRAEY
ncbi:hypothetical protein CDAR_472061 [Caerostris darwini]|uniref:Uncharacterized protein n=1 Tax=Caerostris darwini TaxID=1538125 RepID=A0AAV4VNG1_9ARAC|nr:hypothetical protein CDAR_472061 [Caerostris darwini]